MWVETRGGFTIYNPLTETFDNQLPARLQSLSLPNIALTHLLKDGNGDYWFLMGQKQLFKCASAGKPAILVYTATGGDVISSFASDGQGHFWLVHANGLLEKTDGQTGAVIEKSDALRRVA